MLRMKGGIGLEGCCLENGVKYRIEREFLSEISIEELIIRMIRSHWDNKAQENEAI